jgi:hypothetical protein
LSNTNKYGLSRDIPSEVKRAIRQQAAFGCVICGFAIYQYEHVAPQFSDATTHDPEYMTLLCGSCHDQVTRGIISKEKVIEAMAQPKCKQKGFTFGFFDIGRKPPVVQFGNSIFESDDDFVLFDVNGKDLLRFNAPVEPNEPFTLTASFYDKEQAFIFGIVRNEWKGNVSSWDIETVGKTITIRCGPGNIALQITNIPRERLVINQIDMQYKGYRIFGNDKGMMSITSPHGSRISTMGGYYPIRGKDSRKKAGYKMGADGIRSYVAVHRV